MRIAIVGNAPDLRAIARELRLPLARAVDDEAFDFVLLRSAGQLRLAWTRAGAPGPVAVDLSAGAGKRRWREASRRQPLARAIGIARGAVDVVDATAGLGRDASVLAALGCRVTAVERDRVLFALLEDGLRRAAGDPQPALRALAARIRALCADARDVLAAQRPDVAFLDPMFPPRTKSARVKKDLQLFQELLGPQDDGGELLSAALAAARERVVVKRPLHAPPLAARPDRTIAGTRVRFDVYLVRGS
jgi:16S rRNA (guanine1516-N2)-methyltransferase